MSPNLISACIAYLRSDSTIVAAFGDSVTTPKFWNEYADQEYYPYLIFKSPGTSETYESIDNAYTPSKVADGILTAEVYAQTLAQVQSLTELVNSSLTDADINDLQWSGGDTFYFRPVQQSYPVIPVTGPDGSTTSYKHLCQFRFLSEANLTPYAP